MTVGQSLADFLRHERVPAGLIDRLDYIASPGPAGSWPPRPGCCEHRDIGIVRAWATIDLAAWLRGAPQVFGPHRPHELEQLAAVGAQLRTTGEGAQVLWAPNGSVCSRAAIWRTSRPRALVDSPGSSAGQIN
ncbi:hypothetical protein NCCNTM_55520 [Mycolicibacterium sp. NCC-Tsukiji]|nr:hypothetical protein NCCNTM_55520 [Mycolicibacterium sp. NCC-Tsukiji]